MRFGKKRKEIAKSSYRFSNDKKLPAVSKSGMTVFYILLLCISAFLTASFYTPWTGTYGAKISAYMLDTIGGASIIPLLFAAYFSISKLLSKQIPHPVKQFFATVLLFMLAVFLLGINTITGDYGPDYPLWLSPGMYGCAFAGNIFSTFGAIGTFILGFFTLYLTMILYNIPIISKQKLPLINLLTSLRKRRNDNDTEQTEKPAGDTADLPAPNITECNETDYFGHSRDDMDDAPITSSEIKRLSENPDKASEEVEIQDPSFSFGDNEFHNAVEQGIFPPPIEIFGREESREDEMNEEKSLPLGEKIIKALEQFGIEARLAEILVGPTVIQFRIQLAPGIKVNKVAALANDIALAMAVPSLRIEAPIPGKPYVGVEIPNPRRRGIPLRTIIEDQAYQDSDAILPLPFGIAVSGDAVVSALEELPHLLVAGTTGSGKSVFINSCIVGLCSMRTPEEMRMILVDPKRVEMAVYDKLPHLLTPPVTDPKKAVHVLAWAIREMENRYTMFAKSRVRNIEHFNEKVLPKDRYPHIVIVIDELADLMMTAPKEVEEYICRLAQMARATGIHLMIATQRPSVNVITGLIKANIPARVAFTLPSNADSRTILDCAGAEKLLGKGDMLFLSTKHPKPIRIQSPWVDEQVLNDWLSYLTNIFGLPDFIEIDKQGSGPDGFENTLLDDDLLGDAVDTVMSTGIASASGLQRRLRVGFSRASRLIDMMEQIGIVGPADGSKPREILVGEEEANELLESARNGY